jgi:hypothetical protein
MIYSAIKNNNKLPIKPMITPQLTPLKTNTKAIARIRVFKGVKI